MAGPGLTMSAAAAEKERRVAGGAGSQRRSPRPLAARRAPAEAGAAGGAQPRRERPEAGAARGAPAPPRGPEQDGATREGKWRERRCQRHRPRPQLALREDTEQPQTRSPPPQRRRGEHKAAAESALWDGEGARACPAPGTPGTHGGRCGSLSPTRPSPQSGALDPSPPPSPAGAAPPLPQWEKTGQHRPLYQPH